MPVSCQKVLCPLAIRFAQESIGKAFRDGRDLEESSNSIRACPGTGEYDVILEAPFPPIVVAQRVIDVGLETERTTWFSLDNRRLYCLQHAAMNQWPRHAGAIVRIIPDGGLIRQGWKFDTSSNGWSVRIRDAEEAHLQRQWNWGRYLHPAIDCLESALAHAIPLAAVARDERKLANEVQDALDGQCFRIPAPVCDLEDDVLQADGAIRNCCELLRKFWGQGWANSHAEPELRSKLEQMVLSLFPGRDEETYPSSDLLYDSMQEVLVVEGIINRGLLVTGQASEHVAVYETNPFSWGVMSEMFDDIDAQVLLEVEEQFLDELRGRATCSGLEIASTECHRFAQEGPLIHAVDVLVRRVRKRLSRAHTQLCQGLYRRALLSLTVCSAACSRLCRYTISFRKRPAFRDRNMWKAVWSCCKYLQWVLPAVFGCVSPMTLRVNSLLVITAVQKAMPSTAPLPPKKIVWDFLRHHGKVFVVEDTGVFSVSLATGRPSPVQPLSDFDATCLCTCLNGPHICTVTDNDVLIGPITRTKLSDGFRLNAQLPHGNLAHFWSKRCGAGTLAVASGSLSDTVAFERVGTSFSYHGPVVVSPDETWVALRTSSVQIYDTWSGEAFEIGWNHDFPFDPEEDSVVYMVACADSIIICDSFSVRILQRSDVGRVFSEVNGWRIHLAQEFTAFAFDAGKLATIVSGSRSLGRQKSVSGVVVFSIEGGQGIQPQHPVHRIPGNFCKVALCDGFIITLMSPDALTPQLVQIWPSEVHATCLFRVCCSTVIRGIYVETSEEKAMKDWIEHLAEISHVDRTKNQW